MVAAYKDVPAERMTNDYHWKLVAASAGADALEEVMAPATIRTVQDVDSASATEAKSVVQRKIVEAVKAVDVTDPDAIRDLPRMVESLDNGQPNGADQVMRDEIDALFKSFPFTVGGQNLANASPESIEFSRTHCELTPGEDQRVALGQELENKQELLALRFPEKTLDHEALRLQPKRCGKSVADSVGPENAVAKRVPGSADELSTAGPQPKRVTREMESQYVRDRVLAEKAEAEKRQAAREDAAREAAAKAAELAESATKAADLREAARAAELHRLDCEWEALAGESEGANRNRMWLKFRQQHPGYNVREGRERLATR